jgi:hypothetical protein
MNQLVPCPQCSRHVRVSELACPFCALPLDLSGTPEPRLPSTRLSRAATLAFGATLASATALAACSGSDAPVPVYGAPEGGNANLAGAAGSATAAAGGGVGGGAVAVYGAPAGGNGSSAAAGSGNGGGGPVPVYGTPP